MIKRLFEELRALVESAKRRIGSLNVALIVSFFLGLAVAVAFYLAIDIVSTGVIESVYMQDEKRRERADEYAIELQRYMDTEGVTLKESAAAFTAFMQQNEYVIVSTDDGTQDGEISSEELSAGSYTYRIRTVDGYLMSVVISDTSERFYYRAFEIIKLISSLVALFAVLIVYVQRLTARISKLSREVVLVSGGDTARHVNMPGHDEITELSRSVEEMRASILMKIESERAALDANSELIKAMSHDLRTPLTVLLGYIDMMKERAEGDELMMEYVLASEKTVMRLKRLSDDMFGYFLLFGQNADSLNFENYNFGTLIDQMLAEGVFLLREKEYRAILSIDEAAYGVYIKTDPNMLMRIIENLISNMFKYADIAKDITISVTKEDGFGKLKLTNSVYRGENKVETNGIGLRSCRKIADTLGIDFECTEEGDLYTTLITLPLVGE